jgi:hypothetical protein
MLEADQNPTPTTKPQTQTSQNPKTSPKQTPSSGAHKTPTPTTTNNQKTINHNNKLNRQADKYTTNLLYHQKTTHPHKNTLNSTQG